MIPTSIRRSFRVAALGCLLVAPRQADAARGKPLLTGQTTTYGAVGDTTAGIRRSYVDNGYGFVKDQRTGLYWEKKDDSGGIHDKDDTYTWSTPSSLVADGTAFSEFLAALNTVPCFAGFCDWRLPTKFELETIEDVGRIDPAVKHAFSFVCTAGCVSTFCSCTASNGLDLFQQAQRRLVPELLRRHDGLPEQVRRVPGARGPRTDPRADAHTDAHARTYTDTLTPTLVAAGPFPLSSAPGGRCVWMRRPRHVKRSRTGARRWWT